MVWDFKATARPGSSQPGGGWEEPSEDDDNWYTTNDVEVRPC